MATTGYTDTFGRTVSNGLGTATSGQAYTLFGVNTQFSVAPNVATIAPSTTGDKFGYIDNLTQDVTITGQVALSAVPASNLATVGFIAKLASTSNYYNATMMVATGGAISLRFSKVIGGGLSTIATIATGLTYVANTFYNLTVAIRWSQALQTNVLQSKLWVVGGTQPGGWMATALDSGLTSYTAGTNVGILGRDESTVLGAVTAKIQNVATTTYSLPMPATGDPMCYDPAFQYPKQTALESLADATDAAMATLDPLTSLAGLFPRVRLSATGPFTVGGTVATINFQAVEFNVNTPTNLAYDTTAVWLGPGIWLATFELELASPFAVSDYIYANFFAAANEPNPPSYSVFPTFRSNPSHTGDSGRGGCLHMSKQVFSADPVTPVRIGVSLQPNNSSATYNVLYAALTAIKISDYFT
jgi:hypothetical protein